MTQSISVIIRAQLIIRQPVILSWHIQSPGNLWHYYGTVNYQETFVIITAQPIISQPVPLLWHSHSLGSLCHCYGTVNCLAIRHSWTSLIASNNIVDFDPNGIFLVLNDYLGMPSKKKIT